MPSQNVLTLESQRIQNMTVRYRKSYRRILEWIFIYEWLRVGGSVVSWIESPSISSGTSMVYWMRNLNYLIMWMSLWLAKSLEDPGRCMSSELEQRRGSTLAQFKTCGTSKAYNCSTEFGNRGPDDDHQYSSHEVSLPTATAFIYFLDAYPNYNLKASVGAINSDFLLLFIEMAVPVHIMIHPIQTLFDRTVGTPPWSKNRWKAAKVIWGETYPCQCWIDWDMKFLGLLHIHCFIDAFESVTLYRWKVTRIQCGMRVEEVDCIDALQSWSANQRIWIYKAPNRGISGKVEARGWSRHIILLLWKGL